MLMKIKYTLTAPLSHIGETASTGSYFNTVKTVKGKIPVVTANSIRGQLRNSGAEHLLKILDTKVDKEVFHVLFSGGNLSGTMKNDIDKAVKAREQFPLVSILGGGLGDIILSGKINLSFAYPICAETFDITDIESEISWHDCIDEIEFTRTDDEKNDKLATYINDLEAEKTSKASTQMRYSVQYIAAGTGFIQTLILNTENELEQGALLTAFKEWFKNPTLGGMAAKGFGFFDAEVTVDNEPAMSVRNNETEISANVQELINKYEQFIRTSENNFDILKPAKTEKKK